MTPTRPETRRTATREGDGRPPGARPDPLHGMVGIELPDEYPDRPPPPRRALPVRTRLLAVGVLIGGVVAVAAVQSRLDQPQLELERTALIQQVEQAEVDAARWAERIEAQSAAVDDLQGAGVDSTPARVADERVLSGSVPVVGPGLRVVLDDAEGAEVGSTGRVRDRDLQVLVNALWMAGAEAIAVNGQRLGPQSSIRRAGAAITVNFRSLSPPYTVLAIGDTDELPARFTENASGRYVVGLSENFGIGLELATTGEMELPAVASGRLSTSGTTIDEGDEDVRGNDR